MPEDMDDWGCGHWITYFQKNKDLLGQQEAIDILRIDTDNVGWFADLHLCKYDCDFVDFFQEELGESVGNIFSKLYCTGSTVVDAAGTLAAGAHGGIKVLSVLVPVAVIGAAVWGVSYAYQQYGPKKKR